MKKILLTVFICFCAVCAGAKDRSAFYPRDRIQRAVANAEKHAWAADIRDQIAQAATPWMEFSDDEIWHLMFSPTITRSWMVWSSGYCPSCSKNVPMYNWTINALKHPWKVQCPHCDALFPKNDFREFYQSGLDVRGVFDPERANSNLLFNTQHPDPTDPLHKFGVDDGNGYVEKDRRWRFIGTYLVYGQWKQLVVRGICRLAAAYVVTGDPKYAHKAGILLDRVADFYPLFDFRTQGIMYEGKADAGYVSTWHDACEETREMTIAYDQVFEGLKDDAELVAFLSTKAKQYQLENPKTTFKDIQQNIEERILQDALRNKGKIRNNYPRTDVAVIAINTVLDWPAARESIIESIGHIVSSSTKIDGVTGEKGLCAYASYTIQSFALLLAQYSEMDPTFLSQMMMRYPTLKQTFRFHLDTWCLDQRFYPLSGDCGAFGSEMTRYCGAEFSKVSILSSMFSFFWKLYEITGDADYVRILYHANGDKVEGLPHSIFAEDPAGLQKKVSAVIREKGADFSLRSVNKREWHIAILRSGEGKHKRALWIDYDAGGKHGHKDGMHLGLFAKGLDLMPDFGYPPVQFGGWQGKYFNWYCFTASHNTVAVDGRNQRSGSGTTTLWADGRSFHAFRMSALALIAGNQYEEAAGMIYSSEVDAYEQYERTAAMIDISEEDVYVVDVFRVVGGEEHTKFMHSFFAKLTTQGLTLTPADNCGFPDAVMREYSKDPNPQPGWSVDWEIQDRYEYLPKAANVHLRYTDLTEKVEAYTAEAWIAPHGYRSAETAWIPRIMIRRHSLQTPLVSTFVGVIEPYEKRSNIQSIRRIELETLDGETYPDSSVAIELTLTNGQEDLHILANPENPVQQQTWPNAGKILVQKSHGVRLDGEYLWCRLDPAGNPIRVALCGATKARIGTTEIVMDAPVEFVEIRFDGTEALVVAGPPRAIREIKRNGKPVPVRSKTD